ncbi:MAG: nucleotidyl transferase AbiEii/AbiGii toxin family protein, partial [Euryarchaeota archaeon]|nr:nucleotidyl transferase AbiEii/AbiGii toxin family protein [Euryarchaeota archaeon]MCG2727163.1 nucleotidyl transferase AbiEii/AbiGii toxin family protein [Candidatus Methanoperedenaceae archaeon]
KAVKPVEFFITDEALPGEAVVFPHASIEDLVVDKIMATEEHTGRERFKDIYDLMVLLDLDFEKALINKKLDLIARKTGRDAKELLRSSANTVMAFGDRANEAQGFASMVCRGGKVLIKDWEIGCERTAEKIMQLQL